MDGLTLLRQAWAAGLKVEAEGDRLAIRGPRWAEPLARRLLAHKPVILDLLRRLLDELAPTDLPPDWHFRWGERAAIMEHDAKMPKERAEAEALKDILRQMLAAGIVPPVANRRGG